MATKLTKQAAEHTGNALDVAADLVTKNAAAAGINPKIAEKFAYQCDLISDHMAKAAGFDIAKLAAARTADEDPSQIGEEKSGPKEQDGDESFMNGEFSQQENRELREKVQTGDLSNKGISLEPQAPHAGVQAALANGTKLAALFLDINKAASRCASSKDASVQGLGNKLAAAGIDVLGFQTRLLEGNESPERIAMVTRAAAHVLPHLAADVPAVAVEKLARMVDIFAGVAKAV